MGAAGRLVGVSSYDRFPPDVARLPRVGGLLDPNVERLLAMRPDLVIVYDTQDALKRELERARIPTFEYTHRDLADVTGTMRAIGERVGSADAANAAAAHIEGQLQEVAERVRGLPRPRTLLVFGREPGALRNVQASAGYGFLHDLLEIAGGDDVLADVRRQSLQMSTEMILARAPEVVIELHYGASIDLRQLDAERRVWDTLPALPAVRSKRVYLLVGDEFVVPGPRVVDAARRLAEALHPSGLVN